MCTCRCARRLLRCWLQGGLATVHRDRTYLDMDEEQKAKRLLVISKITTEGWIKTEAQAIIDRAKVKPPNLQKYATTLNYGNTRERRFGIPRSA